MGHVSAVVELVANGAVIKATDAEDKTPLDIAARHVDFISMLKNTNITADRRFKAACQPCDART